MLAGLKIAEIAIVPRVAVERIKLEFLKRVIHAPPGSGRTQMNANEETSFSF